MADVIAIVADVIASVADCTVVDVITTLCWLVLLLYHQAVGVLLEKYPFCLSRAAL